MWHQRWQQSNETFVSIPHVFINSPSRWEILFRTAVAITWGSCGSFLHKRREQLLTLRAGIITWTHGGNCYLHCALFSYKDRFVFIWVASCDIKKKEYNWKLKTERKTFLEDIVCLQNLTHNSCGPRPQSKFNLSKH